MRSSHFNKNDGQLFHICFISQRQGPEEEETLTASEIEDTVVAEQASQDLSKLVLAVIMASKYIFPLFWEGRRCCYLKFILLFFFIVIYV